MTVTRRALSVSLEGKEHNEEDPTKDVDHCSAPRAAGPGQPFPGVPDAGGGRVPASLSGASSSVYSSISTMQKDGGKEAHIEKASVEGRGKV